METNPLSDYILEKSNTEKFSYSQSLGMEISYSLKKQQCDTWEFTVTTHRGNQHCIQKVSILHIEQSHEPHVCTQTGLLTHVVVSPLHLCQGPVMTVTDPSGAWQHPHPTWPPADIPGNGLGATPLPLEARWISCRGLVPLPGRQTRAWDSGLKVDFLHHWAKCFQLSSQMFLCMVLAVMAWDGARIWPDFYTEKLDGMLGFCHPIIKEVAL